MSEYYTHVVQLGPVEKHPNADTLGITQVMGGYPCIVRLDELKEGDLAVYLSVDAMVDTAQPRFAFLKPRAHSDGWHRIRAMKLRGVFSMGLLLKPEPGMLQGDDVTEAWNIVKYEPSCGGDDEGVQAPVLLPGMHLSKYDIEGLRRHPGVLKEGEEVQITCKIHGACARYVYTDRLHVGSHGMWKQPDGTTIWARAAKLYNMAEKLARLPNVVIYGEVYGAVQDMRYGVPKGSGEVRFAMFDALLLRSKRPTFVDYDELVGLAKFLDLPLVPLLYRGPWKEDLRSLAEGPSTIKGADHCREGIVVKPVAEREEVGLGRLVLKLHGQGFLLRKEK